MSMDKDFATYKIKNSDGSYTETTIGCPKQEMDVMSRYTESIEIQTGLVLNIIDIPADVELSTEFEYLESPLYIGCSLQCDYEMDFFKDGELLRKEYTKGAKFFISKTSNISGHVIKKSTTNVQGLSLSFDNRLAKLLFGSSLLYLKDKYRPYFEQNSDFLLDITEVSPLLKAVAKSIIFCQYSEPRRSLFIKAKAYEILNYAFSEHLMANISSNKSVLQPNEIKKMMDIRQYISSHIETPPSLHELSRFSGINDFKLKAGFKEMFGTTIYGYIQSEKMSKAKQMLETGNYSVSEVAWDIGYTNVSHFITAFKKNYKVTPGQLLSHIKSNITQFKTIQ